MSVNANTGAGTKGNVHKKIIKGIPISPGVGFGRPCFYHNNTEDVSDRQKIDSTDQNISLLDAFSQLGKQLLSMTRKAEEIFDHDSAAIFRAHKMICEELQTDILNTVKQGQLTAIDAIEECFDNYFEYFNGLNNDYLSGRGNDFAELKKLLLSLLNNNKTYLTCREYQGCQVGECVLGNEHILVADELTANVAIRIRDHTKGIITEKCGANSHAAVIARSLDMPVISGIKDPVQLLSHRDNILINGMTGELFINPDKNSLAKYRTRINRPHDFYEVVEPLPQFTVLADIDNCQNVTNAIKVKADGVGLYRTEYELLSKGRELSETEQIACYQHVVDGMQGKPVYFRLYDLGSDKSAPWLEMPAEDNPALGCRGARFLLTRPELVKSQARAIATVSSSSHVNVIYPMISGLDQFLQLKKIFLEAITGFKHANIRHGIMFEVPSVCLQAEELYQEIDFGRIGSNDLVQYLFAYDRTRDDFCFHDLAENPAIWKIIGNLAAVARKAEKPLELCGTMATIPEFIPKLIEFGIHTISIGPKNIAGARRAALSCFA